MARKFFKRILPSAQAVRESRALWWLGPLLLHPRLWHVNRDGIALGLAIGVFMGLLIPLGQIPFAALLAVIVRANLPIAVASTLITNPFTFAPLYVLAYRIGAALLGEAGDTVTEDELEVEFSGVAQWLTLWRDKLVALGKPLIVGLMVMATAAALAAYWSVMLLWHVHVRYQLWQRRRRRDR